jgi:deazaflavin-dependent oxidoreductase (nitroreductase family)
MNARAAARPPDGSPAASSDFGDLPYGPIMSRLLEPLYRCFPALNRYVAVPMLRAGLGPLLGNPCTGYLMLLRTTGRRSGLPRDTPLGYSILDGAVYCCAGFGTRTQWYRNVLADPRVEVVLPAASFVGTAEEVTDPEEWVRGFRHLIASLGVIGRLTVGDARTAPDDALRAMGAGLPLIRIRPTGIAAGLADPGGRLWLLSLAAQALLIRWLVRRLGGRSGSGRSG